MSEPGPPFPPRAHLGALVVLLAHVFLFTMGAPGFDYMSVGDYDSAEEEAEIIDEHPLWGRVVVALYALNREVRRPLMTHLKPIERSFRIAQDWNLYRDGPSRVRRLEVYVDGELKHRSADPDYTWLNPQLRNRKIRPALENAARKASTPNWPGIVRYIAQQAREDFPGAQQVEVHATWSMFPGTTPEFHHGYKTAAPDWAVEPLTMTEFKARQEAE